MGVDVMVVVVMRRKCDVASLACVRSIVLCNNFYLRKCETGGELGQLRLANHDRTQFEELLYRGRRFGGDFVGLEVGQGTSGGWETFDVVDVLEPEPSARLGVDGMWRRDGTGMSCGRGSSMSDEEDWVILVGIHPPFIMSGIEPKRKPAYSSG